jgi:hypothetical protein
MGSLEELDLDPTNMDFDNITPEKICGLGPRDFEKMPPQAFREMKPDHFNHMDHDALGNMTPEQFDEVPLEAMQGLGAHNMGGLPPKVIRQVGLEHIAEMDREQFQQMPSHGISTWMVNIDIDVIPRGDVEELLPKEWRIQDNGEVKGPPGSQLALPPKPPKNPLSSQIKLPEPPDLGKCVCLGGEAPTEDRTELHGLNQGLAQGGFADISVIQREEDGILNAQGSGLFEGLNLAFIPDSNRMTQTEDNAPIGLSVGDGEQYQITTPDRHQLSVIPALNNPQGFMKTMPSDSNFQMGKRGDILLEIPGQKRSRVIGMADPVIERAPSDKGPGLHFMQMPDGEEQALLVSDDGTMQRMRPTCLSPAEFVKKGQQFEGVEGLKHRMDGDFELNYLGQPLRLEPTFDVQSEPLGEGELIGPDITIEPDGTLEYKVQNGTELLRMKLLIKPQP